jgi:hypothetical protein
LEIICSTQYGKSLVVALACLIITCFQNEVVAVIAPTNDKAKIIMRYFIEHLGDNRLFSEELDYETKLERLRQEDSKQRIILRNGGGIFVLSAQQKSLGKSIESAMGQGAKIVIMDEACLINDQTEATIFRMIAGKGADAFYCKIGNPFYNQAPNTHFYESWHNPNYARIFIDHRQAIKENRYSQEFIDEAHGKPLFDILFACEFPPEDAYDADGYLKLILNDQICFVSRDKFDQSEGDIMLGCDIGGGGDKSVFVGRKGRVACCLGILQTKDTMVNVKKIEELVKEYGIKWDNVFIDDIGIGRGVSDRLKEIYWCVGVSVGTPARDKNTFFNLKAELTWKAKLWVEGGGVFVKEDGFNQLTWIKYKQATGDKAIQIEPKERLKARTHKSPDYADAFILTFYEQAFVGFA